MKKFVLFLMISVFGMVWAVAQNNKKNERPAVIRNIESNSKTVVNQDSKLDKLIDDYLNRQEESTGSYTGPGYRVQVFSSNQQQSAKSEAMNVEQKIRSAFPDHGVYRIYASPFWKVRIGNFKSLQDAQAFRSEVVKAFPEFRKETYTVRESKVVVK